MPIFYKRTCNAPGHNEKIISFYSDVNKKVKIYDYDYYWSDKWDGLDFGRTYDFSRGFFSQFNELSQATPHQSLHRDPKSVDCDYVVSGLSSKNCYYCSAPLHSENVYYSRVPFHSRDCLDTDDALYSEWCYGCILIERCYNCNFCIQCSNCLDSWFLFDCRNCQNCFGCANLRNKRFCIFNKQYGEVDYLQLVDKIKVQMLKAGEYGEFFPLQFSPFPHNDSSASVEFPLSKEEILSRGWHYQDEVKSEIDLSKFKVIQARELPQEISGITDDILDKVIICEETGKPFRITKYELDFYRRKNLPLPTIHPLERIKKHVQKRQPYRLWQYPCAKCGSLMWSSYNPEKKLKVLCESCYNREVV